MANGLINRAHNVFVGDIFRLLCAPVQELLELPGKRSTILGRWELLRRNSRDTNFLVGADRPAQELVNSRPHTLWQFAGLLDRDILHGVNVPRTTPLAPRSRGLVPLRLGNGRGTMPCSG